MPSLQFRPLDKKVNCGYSDRFRSRKSEGLTEYRKEQKQKLKEKERKERKS